MSAKLRWIIEANRENHKMGIFAVCSAHPLVLEAAFAEAKAGRSPLLIEATSNQVDQFGGYTGMTPEVFRDFVLGLAEQHQFPIEDLILGGDHLGPNRWQGEPAEQAMAKAEDLVRAYVAAGYQKIHLDCSMSCADDESPLSDTVVANRAARLLAAAEDEAARVGAEGTISYVIGTEVPTPGGAKEDLTVLVPTTPEAARATLNAHKQAFAARGLEDRWPQIAALVVQPAVEFDHLQVVDYISENTKDLQQVLADERNCAFEAHSTDYQTEENLRKLVEDGWAILKVGPGLTFALREGLFALSAIEGECIEDPTERADIGGAFDAIMIEDPRYWEAYYEGDDAQKRMARRYSYSDRIRYYLADPRAVQSVEKLLENLRNPIPEPLISQFMPSQYSRVREGLLEPTGKELLLDHVRQVLRTYASACGNLVPVQ